MTNELGRYMCDCHMISYSTRTCTAKSNVNAWIWYLRVYIYIYTKAKFEQTVLDHLSLLLSHFLGRLDAKVRVDIARGPLSTLQFGKTADISLHSINHTYKHSSIGRLRLNLNDFHELVARPYLQRPYSYLPLSHKVQVHIGAFH